MVKLFWWSHSVHVWLSSFFSFQFQTLCCSPSLNVLFFLLTHLSSPSSLGHLPSPFLPNTALKYEFRDEFHDEFWHLVAETRLMRAAQRDAELTDRLLASARSEERWGWAASELNLPQVATSQVFSRRQCVNLQMNTTAQRLFNARSESHFKLGRAQTEAKALHTPLQ